MRKNTSWINRGSFGLLPIPGIRPACRRTGELTGPASKITPDSFHARHVEDNHRYISALRNQRGHTKTKNHSVRPDDDDGLVQLVNARGQY